MPLRVYNTLSRQKEDFQTVEPGKVSMYLCGPTVYKPAHIGHMVGPVIFDTIKRYLTYSGYKVTWVVNITDVDDKLINRANEKGITVEALAKQMTQDYFDNLATMGVDGIDHFPYATQHIKEMQEIIATLIEKGYAYPLEGDVYFNCTKDEDYGKLSGRSLEQLLAGTRAETHSGKRHPADFALWKGSKPGEPAWDSPWGPGRPGWHIECSAMAKKILGDSIDIHGGGLDLMFPHHENELAQSESCTGKPFARYWMHNGLMQSSGSAGKVGGGHDKQGDKSVDLTAAKEAQEANKLAGSKGAASVKELFAKHDPETIRFFLLATHYRSPIDFSDEQIAQRGESLDSFYRLFETCERITGQSFYALKTTTRRSESVAPPSGDSKHFCDAVSELRERYLEAMDDDFNTGGAVGVLFELRKTLNSFISENKLDVNKDDQGKISALVYGLTILKELAAILGVFRTPKQKAASADDGLVEGLMQLVIQIRADARKNKNFPVADLIRNKLNELKITLEDRTDQTLWRRG
ncbi:cysteine--tRNA ligase [Schlesneria paludicola]|uniref:cysteine--tRNA ligase n=1 Tax=Schlesneria paludicola TaxID=360056 RepID=UPI00029B3CD7|nr:cysteine--tRNA ligase [Schlesneria paludicola]